MTNRKPVDNRKVHIPALFRYLPGWRGNLFLFTCIIAVVLVYFSWQISLVNKSFQQHSHDLADTLSRVVGINIERTVLSQQSIEEIVAIFLGNTANFIEYLDNLESFSAEELAAFAQETGLVGIRKVEDGVILEGPAGWLSENYPCGQEKSHLQYLAAENIYLLRVNSSTEDSCIMVGLASLRIKQLHQQTGLDQLLASLAGLPGIKYVKLSPKVPGQVDFNLDEIDIIVSENETIARVWAAIGGKQMELGLDADRFTRRLSLLKNEVFLFVGLLAGLGIFFTILLFRYQQAEQQRIQEFERKIASQDKDAALGRATATITHELRNPLNALNMGLQRLELESSLFSNEHKEIVQAMANALKRSNRIISDLQHFTHASELDRTKINCGELLKVVLPLYRQRCRELKISVNTKINPDLVIDGDMELLGQVVENLLKNSIEAQTEGGFLQIEIGSDGDNVILDFVNGGLIDSSVSLAEFNEPYFTTKTTGSGLGLVISRRIVEAHGGELIIDADRAMGVFSAKIIIPRVNRED